MVQMNRIKVVIDNVVYELSSSEPVEHIQTVANYIDRKIKNIYSVKSEGAINPSLRTLFVSLNIADDLFKEKEKVKVLEREASGTRKELVAAKEKNEQIEKDFAAIKKELEQAKAELRNAKKDRDERNMRRQKNAQANQAAQATQVTQVTQETIT